MTKTQTGITITYQKWNYNVSEMQDFRKKFYDSKLRKSTKKVLSKLLPGISILTQPLLMNLESFPHGARELVIDIGTSSIVYLFSARVLDPGTY